MFNQKAEEGKEDSTQKPEVKKINKDRLAMFNQNKNPGNQENISNIKKPDKKVNTFESKDKVNKVNINNNSNLPKKDRKEIIFEKSTIISDENPNNIIRKYNNISIAPKNKKIILLIGDNQEAFINTIINVYSNIDYKDNYRYKIESSSLNDKLRTYNIASISDSEDIFIIAFPSFNKVEDIFNNEVMKSYVDLVNKNFIKKINYLFITVEKNKFLNKNEFIYFLYFVGLIFDEKLKERIIILFSSDKETKQGDNDNIIINDIFKDTKEYISSEENLGFNFNSLFTPEYFYINNKIIYEKNNNPEEEEQWKSLSEIMKKIQNKISNSNIQTFDTNNINLINKLIQKDNKSVTIYNLPELKKIEKKRDQIILLNYLTYSNIKNDISNIIIYLLQKIYDNKIKISKGMKEINFKDLYNLHINIYTLTKIEFNNLQSINFQNCAIEDEIITIIQNIFTLKLVDLNLSYNKFTNLQIFNKENIFNNLNILNLSHNNIEEITLLMSGKYPNLKKLNLSHNKIKSIKCLENLLNFNKLEELDLSYNNIKEINKINIPSLKIIIMTNNPISEGIANFNAISYGANEFVLNKKNNELNFNYSKFEYQSNKNIMCITFSYAIKENDINNILEKIDFKGIKKLVIKGFDKIDFLSNDTLETLEVLDLKDNNINDISILNKVKFNNKLKELYVKDNIYFTNGFNSLKNFNGIHIKIIYITNKNNKYLCRVVYNISHEINFIFDDLEFLKDKLFLKAEKIDIDQSVWDNNLNFFSEAIKDIKSYPLFKIKPKALTIYSKNEKYEIYCEKDEFYSYLKMQFFLSDLNIFNLEFFDSITSINFIDVIFNDNINLSLKTIPNIKTLYLRNNIIKSYKIISIINELKQNYITIESEFSNKCVDSLLELLDEKVSMKNIEVHKENNNDCIINYCRPFKFSLCINKKRLNEIISFKLCENISLNKMELNDNDINWLKHETLSDLRELNLDNNKITNIEFLDKIKSKKINIISIKNNLINDGIKYIEDNIKSEKIREIKIKKSDDENTFIISLYYSGSYQLYYDMFYEANKNLEILKSINLDNICTLDLSNLNLKNIDFLSNKSLLNIKNLNLDNNQIEDISILPDVSIIKIYDLSLQKNPVRKGLHVLKNDFFKQNKNIYISVSKEGNEYKINAEFNYQKVLLEFFINEIEDIKNIFDFEYCFINLKKNNIQENESLELYNKVKNLLNDLQKDKNDTLNYINDDTNFKEESKVFNIYNSNIEEDDYKPNIIIDIGSCYCKAGFSGEWEPRAVFPTCVGYPKYAMGMIDEYNDKKNYFIGTDAEYKRGVLKLNYPIEKGCVNNWDNMEKIIGHIFTNELRAAPEEHNVMITEAPNNQRENREKIAQIMFETFNVPCLYIANQSPLSLHSAGKFDGISVDLGEVSKIVPVFDGFPISFATEKLNIGGQDLTEYLTKLLIEVYYRPKTESQKELVKVIKEKCCYVALNFEEEVKNVETYEYELPDDTHIYIKDQRIRCPEVLFKPTMLGEEGDGIGQICYNAIQKCDIDIRQDLYNNIVISGGTSMFNGLPERLTKEIKLLAPKSMKESIRVIALPERKFTVWIGGSIISNCSSFESSWITKTEYETYGATIVHRKCF